MSRYPSFVLLMLLATCVALADDTAPRERAAGSTEETATAEASKEAPAEAQKKEGAKEISGMSILGNQEAPKSLVIVPWKSSEIGAAVGISTMLDDSRQPVDREVFLRALRYWEIRSETTP